MMPPSRKPGVTMPVAHLPPDASAENVAELLARDGCCVVDRVANTSTLQALSAELEPYFQATKLGPDDFSGKFTSRTGGLIERSPTARQMIEDPLIIGAVAETLKHAKNFQLHLTQVIAIGPGESDQLIHRDQWAFDFFPFPKGYQVQCNTIWAMTDFTEANGATRVIPGSHLYDDGLEFSRADTDPAEMEAGSVLFYIGSLYHGGGANSSNAVRRGLNITYALAWLRQEENQYLSVSRETAAELPESLLRLMGYAQGAYALGYIDDLRDPIEAVRPELSTTRHGFGDFESTQERVASLRDTDQT
jgi:ectoine hydroxylase-related dioxygenase (phytanoyl-CoA dioxygenase family)